MECTVDVHVREGERNDDDAGRREARYPALPLHIQNM
jgi:hypothetical protein